VQQASKNTIINEMRSAWTRHQDAAYYTEWFAGDINNAKLATVAAYFDWVPAFEQLFLNSGQQFEVFLTQVEAMTHMSDGDRQQQLSALQSVRLRGSDLAVIRTNF
jgi:predicted aminopeptidase